MVTKKKPTKKAARAARDPDPKPGRPRSYSDPPPAAKGLFAARDLRFDPPLEYGQGLSYDRSLVRTLRAWKRGLRDELRVTCDGAKVTPELVDWNTLPKVPQASGPSGARKTPQKVVALTPSCAEALEAAAALYGTRVPSETIERALREAIARGPSK